MATGGYDPKDAILMAEALRRAGAEATIAPIRGRLITLARELEAAAESCVEGYEIIPVALVQRGQSVVTDDGRGTVFGISVKNRGEFLIRGQRAEPDRLSGSLELWAEYLCGASPCVVRIDT